MTDLERIANAHTMFCCGGWHDGHGGSEHFSWCPTANAARWMALHASSRPALSAMDPATRAQVRALADAQSRDLAVAIGDSTGVGDPSAGAGPLGEVRPAPAGTGEADWPCRCGSPLGCRVHGPEPRERTVPCRVCRTPTLNVLARCDDHLTVRPDRNHLTGALHECPVCESWWDPDDETGRCAWCDAGLFDDIDEEEL